jgi:isopentenyl-diphosphate delta-isomerase
MADLIDMLSETGLRTGEIFPHAEIHRLGKCHRAIHLYILNAANEILLQKRAQKVDHYPGYYGISVTGHVAAGESSSDCVRRELDEELGINHTNLDIDFLFSYFQEVILNDTFIDCQFNDLYITRAEIRPEDIVMDPSEVSEIKFVAFEQFHDMVTTEQGNLAPVYKNECRDLIYFMKNSRT